MTEASTGDWFQTYTGRAWYPLAPRPADVDLVDIAHGLAYQCRFNGHCSEFYSVADHSLRVAAVMAVGGPAAELAGLLHDAAESYLGDLVRPIKRELRQFYDLERRNQFAIFEGLGVPIGPDDYAASVREADLILLATERRDLMAAPPMSWVSVERVDPLPSELVPLPAAQAQAFFVRRFELLMLELRG